MHRDDSPAELLRSLETADEWGSVCDQLELWAKAGRWEDVAEVHRAICRQGSRGVSPAAANVRACAEGLAARDSSPEACDVAVAMLADVSRRRLATELPGQIPGGHGWEAVRRRLERLAASLHPETMAELITGFLLCGRLPESADFAEAVWQRLRRAGSDLAWTPPRRSEMESRYTLRSCYQRGGGTAHQAVPRGASPALTGPHAIEPAMLPAFKGMLTESNGKVEAVRFEPRDGVFSPSHGLAVELTRHFAPLVSAKKSSALLVDPREVVAAILSLAIDGSVYERPLSPARGRLATWQTLAAMTQTPAEAPFTAVEAAVTGGSWIEFKAQAGWFYQPEVAGGCLAFIPEDGAWATAIAWTDTD